MPPRDEWQDCPLVRYFYGKCRMGGASLGRIRCWRGETCAQGFAATKGAINLPLTRRAGFLRGTVAYE
ncbi:hypothetical protein WM40_19625 [Robbsia andropogonis]|uniref:Uncharacterized protein n=1 Tax=Robbsia andropogonis TaxID=28092 RepID=A0A0F5JWL2_9BURK|nr:hypothetical protein WM40_19625 [Robbsia andropogonis]